MPASEVKDMEGVFANPQVQARSMHQSVSHPETGSIEMPGSPMHFSRTPTRISRYPPRLGEHTRAVLHDYGYSSEEVKELYETGVLGEEFESE